MSQRNVDVVRGLQPDGVDLVQFFGSEEAGRQLIAGVGADVISPRAAISFVAAEPGLTRPEYDGVEGLVAGWRDWLEGWDSYVIELEDLLDAGDQVVSLVRIKGKTSRHGVEVEHAPASLWMVEDGVITGLTFYLDRDQALEAAGLAE